MFETGSLDIFICETKTSNPNHDQCKGLFFRARKNWFRNSNGEFVYSVRFRPLLKRSCKGCDKCLYMMDTINEEMETIMFPLEPKDGDVYQLMVTNVYRDWETGYIDDWDTEFVKVNE